MRGSSLSSGWKVAAMLRPCRTTTGSLPSVPRISTPGPTRSILGARMKTISSGAANADIDGAQSDLFGVLDFLSEQDRAGASSEGGLVAHEFLQLLETSF